MGIDAEMFVKVNGKVSDDRVRELQYALGAAFQSCFWMSDDKTKPARVDADADEGGRHCIERIRQYQQDGPTLVPPEDETWLRVNLMTRFYGEGYERGNLPDIIAIATFLEIATDGRVWYGGDSSGIEAEPFPETRRKELFLHYVKCQHEPYRRTFSDLSGPEAKYARDCAFCQRPMVRNGFGADFAMLHCSGCGNTAVTRDGAETWMTREEDEKAPA